MENCVFCKIISGKIPSATVYEDNAVVAFLDINPANKGHCLIVPKEHSEDLISMHSHALKDMMPIAKRVCDALVSVTGCSGYNLHMSNGKDAGQEVFHAHLHIVPRFKNDDIKFSYKAKQYSEGEMQLMQQMVQKALQ